MAGQNVLLVSDDNSGGGPSAGSYDATVTYTSAVPEPSSVALALLATAFLAGGKAVARLRRGPAGPQTLAH